MHSFLSALINMGICFAGSVVIVKIIVVLIFTRLTMNNNPKSINFVLNNFDTANIVLRIFDCAVYHL